MFLKHWHLAKSLEIWCRPCKGRCLDALIVARLRLMDRIATFRSFISKTPTDPFPRYGLAMEHKTRGELTEAWTVFSELIEKFPDYVPTYLMAGSTLVALGRK